MNRLGLHAPRTNSALLNVQWLHARQRAVRPVSVGLSPGPGRSCRGIVGPLVVYSRFYRYIHVIMDVVVYCM